MTSRLRMRLLIASLLAASLTGVVAGAQAPADSSGPRIVSGRVVDSASGRPLRNVTIALVGTAYGVLTDSLGAFHVEVRRRAFELLVRAIGYRALTRAGDATVGPDSVHLGDVRLVKAGWDGIWWDRVPDCRPIRQRPDSLSEGRSREWVRESSDSTGRVQLWRCGVMIGPDTLR